MRGAVGQTDVMPLTPDHRTDLRRWYGQTGHPSTRAHPSAFKDGIGRRIVNGKRDPKYADRESGPQTLHVVKIVFPRGDAASLMMGFNADGKITGISLMSMAGD
jgi:hypothetical protein